MKKMIRGVAIVAALSVLAGTLPACGNTSNEHTHDYEVKASVSADCESEGYNVMVCKGCGNAYTEKTAEPLGHQYAETGDMVTYFLPCTREGCDGGTLIESNHKYDEALSYTFTEADKTAIDTLYNAILKNVNDIGKYDGEVYDESSPIYTSYLEFSDLYNQLLNYKNIVTAQMENAELQMDLANNDEKAQQDYLYINDISIDLNDDLTSLKNLLASSKYRKYYFKTLTDEEIDEEFGGESSVNTTLSALNKTSAELLTEYNSLDDVTTSTKIPALYARVVANNNAIAKENGYDNFMEYAYDKTYNRDYTPADAQTVTKYAKTYLAPLLTTLSTNYQTSLSTLSLSEENELKSFDKGIVFTSQKLMYSFDSFLKLISTYSTINYAQNFEDIVQDGVLFFSGIDYAYTNNESAINHSVLVFGSEYQESFTLVHEFGHYSNDLYSYNELYLDKTLTQSMDLWETHSQGLELMYLNYLQNTLSPDVANAFTYYKLLKYTVSLLRDFAVNMFEQAVYTNTYTGTNADVIMKDGQITSDEYDLLYESINSDMGLTDYASTTYWRRVTFDSEGYYVSYGVSLLGALQIYNVAQTQSLQTAMESYTKLTTYVNDHPEYTYAQVLKNAGFYTYTDEALFKALKETLSTVGNTSRTQLVGYSEYSITPILNTISPQISRGYIG
jgi:hypothetical protein